MTLLLVAHGTRRPSGVAMIGDIADHVSRLLDRRVHAAFVDVLGPTPTEVLSSMAPVDEPVIVVPAFLSRGYHVRIDLPAHVAASGHPHVVVAPTLGPSPHIVRLLGEQLLKAGWHQGDSVILAAAGTSDATARSDLHTTATLLSALTGSRVELAIAAIGAPSVADAVAKARRRSSRPVVVGSYLLADGLFAQQLRNCGADIVTDPLGNHPRLVRLIASRFQRARMPLPA
ncbi:sirohydrochlorin chelatase [Mycobacterium noviomagense]|uniref:Cobalamin biosynthesis protein CbiX n=1 Tax=Mycobacterium noviomagense TaxID=459858 RepID=A0A7I7PDT4_9MYCO|nr:sirohydrochlorin chelatase [Mycobacterium noviomagense]ORB12434.1 cobalamin biosynthesis protein CbiX [Mycobacterium noviomagense]BBY06695.1 cobalamin biosynthesis protein CbiX [Mycobacterium noviomagense]